MARKNGKNGKNEPSNHHIVPQSRGGGDGPENIKVLPKRFHGLWHDLFGNMTPQESIRFIKEVFLGETRKGGQRKKPKKCYRVDELYDLQLSIQRNTIKSQKGKGKKKEIS